MLSLSGVLLEHAIEHRVLLGGSVRQVHVSRPARGSRAAGRNRCTPLRTAAYAASWSARRMVVQTVMPRVYALVAVGVVDHLPRHFRDEFGVHGRRLARRRTHRQWRILCFPELVVVDIAKLMHPSQHIELPGFGPARIADRVVRGRRLGQARQHRRLGDGDLGERLAEVDLRRGGEAVGALAEEDLVDVELEDLVLGQAAPRSSRRAAPREACARPSSRG